MSIRVWRYNYGLGTIYAELDKNKTSIMDLIYKAFAIAEDFGFIRRVEVTTESIGEDAFVENYNIQGTGAFKPIDQLHITTKAAGAIYVKIDKHKTTQLDLINKIFLAAQSFGYVSYIKMVTVSAGDDAFRKSFNVQEARTLASHNQMKVTKSHPTEDLISFIEQNSDITEMHIDLGTTCYNENYEWEVFGEAITLSFYTEADEEDWGLYIKVNTDIFVPFRWVRDERTEEMAQKKKKRTQTKTTHPRNDRSFARNPMGMGRV